jgi:hypothetical protein
MNSGRPFERRSDQQLLRHFSGLCQLIRCHQIGLCHDKDAGRNTEQVKNFQMFQRLFLHTLLCINDKQHHVHPIRPREHVSDKPFMTRNINDTGARTIRQIEVGKSQLD